jgi:hypothetical protein
VHLLTWRRFRRFSRSQCLLYCVSGEILQRTSESLSHRSGIKALPSSDPWDPSSTKPSIFVNSTSGWSLQIAFSFAIAMLGPFGRGCRDGPLQKRSGNFLVKTRNTLHQCGDAIAVLAIGVAPEIDKSFQYECGYCTAALVRAGLPFMSAR